MTSEDIQYTIKEKALLRRIYENVFPDETLSMETKSALQRVAHYLCDHSPGEYTGEDDKEKTRQEFIQILNEATVKVFGMTTDEIMAGNRASKNIQMRSICYAKYREEFPMDTSREITEAFGNKKNPSTIRIQLLRFKKGENIHKDTTYLYKRLTQEIDIIKYQRSILLIEKEK